MTLFTGRSCRGKSVSILGMHTSTLGKVNANAAKYASNGYLFSSYTYKSSADPGLLVFQHGPASIPPVQTPVRRFGTAKMN